MEDKNIVNKDFDWIVYDSFQNHCTRVKELQKKSKAEKLLPDESKELTYHKDRIDCIKRFAENKNVPVVYVPDKYFDDNCKAPNSYDDADNALFDEEYSNNWSELLYPKGCTQPKDKDALVLNSLPMYFRLSVKQNPSKYCTKIDRANPYLPDGKFSVRQKSGVNDCWILSIIIGIIDHDAKYIPKKMVRDYPDNNQVEKNADAEGNEDVNNDIDQRPNKAVVRLHDEDGLPVDIVVDKTRPAGDKRPLWIIMLEKAVCVMMGINKFKKCYNKPSDYDVYQFTKGQRTVLGIDWNNIGSPEKDGSRTLSSGDIENNFNITDIDYGQESVGIRVILGKNNKQLDSNNEVNKIENIQQNLTSKKLVLIGTGGNPGALINSNHVLYLKNINKDEMTTIDSLSAELNKSAKNNIKSDTVVHVSDFPNSERSIEKEIDENRINAIEKDILGQKEDILQAEVTNNNEEKEVTNNNKEKDGKSNNPYDNLEPQSNNDNQVTNQDKPEDDKKKDIDIANQEYIGQINSNDNNDKSSNNKEKGEDNSSEFGIDLNEDRKSNNPYNNNNQVDDQDKRENNKEENIYIENEEQINFNDDYGKSETEETHNSSQSSSTQKPSNKFKNIGIAAIILGVLGFFITLIIKLLLIETLSLLAVILPPLVAIVFGIILICIHKKFYTQLPTKIKVYKKQNSLQESIQHIQERNQGLNQEQESFTGIEK